MNTFSADSIAVHLSSPLASDQHNILAALLGNDLLVTAFKQDELSALVAFFCATSDPEAEEMVLRIFLKADARILAMFDDDLVPRLVRNLESPVANVRLYSITNLSILSEISKQVVETLLRDSKGASTLVGLLGGDSVSEEIRQQTLFLLLDVTKGHELSQLLTFHELVDPLVGLLSAGVGCETGLTALRVLSNVLSDKQAAGDFLQSEAFHSFFDRMEGTDFLSYPARMTAEYFHIIRLLFESHEGSLSELLMHGAHLNGLLEVVASAGEQPFIAQNVLKCLERLIVSGVNIGYLICTHQRLGDIVELATASPSSEIAWEIVRLLCTALRTDPRCQAGFCSKSRCLDVLVRSIVSQVDAQTYQTGALALFLHVISNNRTLQGSLAETTFLRPDYTQSLIAWMVDQICTCPAVSSAGDPQESLSDRQVFHLGLCRVLLEWIDGSAIAVEHAKNVMGIISSTVDFFAAGTWNGHEGFFRSWQHTFGVLLLCNLYNATRDEKWVVILCTEMKVSRIYGCCDRCLKDPQWAEKVKSSQPVSQFPIDAAFCLRMRAVFENVMHWVSSDLAWRDTHRPNMARELNSQALIPNQDVNEGPREEITSTQEPDVRTDQTTDSPPLQQKNSPEARVESPKQDQTSNCQPLIEDKQWVKDFASFKLKVNDELETLHRALAEQKQICAQHESEVKELRELIDAMNAFQGFG